MILAAFDVGATIPDDPSLKWLLGTLIVALVGILAYVVKAVVDKIGPGQDRIVQGITELTSAVKSLPDAVADAVRDRERSTR